MLLGDVQAPPAFGRHAECMVPLTCLGLDSRPETLPCPGDGVYRFQLEASVFPSV